MMIILVQMNKSIDFFFSLETMGVSEGWSVESKEFDLSVVGGCTVIRIREKCKGVTRSILLDKDEAVWLIKSYDELVTVQDSGVF